MSQNIMLIFGTRPEAIKVFPVVHAVAAHPDLNPIVCVSAQHRELLDQVLEIGQVKPDYDLDIMQENQNLDSLTALLLTKIGAVLDEVQPDRVLVQGDTATAMTGALAAYYRKIPVGHIEAGLRSHNIYHPWPEEVNRKIIGNIADLHFVPTPTAEQSLLNEAVDAGQIHVTGNTVIDALHWVNDRISQSPELASGLDELKQRFAGKKIVGVTSHRRENFGDGMQNIASAIAELAERDDVAIIFPMHPNPNVRKHMAAALEGKNNVALIDPLNYPHFVHLLSIAHIMLTDSGGVQEEAPAFGKPVLVMRETTERPEGVEAGTAKLVGTNRDDIVRSVAALLDDEAEYARMAKAHNPFGDGKSSDRIVRLIAQ